MTTGQAVVRSALAVSRIGENVVGANDAFAAERGGEERALARQGEAGSVKRAGGEVRAEEAEDGALGYGSTRQRGGTKVRGVDDAPGVDDGSLGGGGCREKNYCKECLGGLMEAFQSSILEARSHSVSQV